MTDRRGFLRALAVTAMAPEVQAAPTQASRDPNSERSSRSPGESNRILPKNANFPRMGYGCASLVGWDNNPISAEDFQKAERAVHTALNCGINLFDHADIYAFGKAETLFGQILRRSPGLRSQIIIQSKCGQHFPAGWKPGDPVQINLSGEHIVSSVEGSLQRLNTDRLDMLLLHTPDALMHPVEVAQAFSELKRSGKVRQFGVSNHNAVQIALLKQVVPEPLVANQIHISLAYPYSLLDGMEFSLQLSKGLPGDEVGLATSGPGTIDYCRSHGIQIQAWSPLQIGRAHV